MGSHSFLIEISPEKVVDRKVAFILSCLENDLAFSRDRKLTQLELRPWPSLAKKKSSMKSIILVFHGFTVDFILNQIVIFTFSCLKSKLRINEYILAN